MTPTTPAASSPMPYCSPKRNAFALAWVGVALGAPDAAVLAAPVAVGVLEGGAVELAAAWAARVALRSLQTKVLGQAF